MGSSPEQLRVQRIEDVAFPIGAAQTTIRTVAERIANRARTQHERDDIALLAEVYQELETLKRKLIALTPYGRT